MFSGAETPQPRSAVAPSCRQEGALPGEHLELYSFSRRGYEAGFSLGCFLIPNFGSSCKAPCFEPSDNILVKISLPRGLPPTLSSMLPPHTCHHPKRSCSSLHAVSRRRNVHPLRAGSPSGLFT